MSIQQARFVIHCITSRNFFLPFPLVGLTNSVIVVDIIMTRHGGNDVVGRQRWRTTECTLSSTRQRVTSYFVQSVRCSCWLYSTAVWHSLSVTSNVDVNASPALAAQLALSRPPRRRRRPADGPVGALANSVRTLRLWWSPSSLFSSSASCPTSLCGWLSLPSSYRLGHSYVFRLQRRQINSVRRSGSVCSSHVNIKMSKVSSVAVWVMTL